MSIAESRPEWILLVASYAGRDHDDDDDDDDEEDDTHTVFNV